MHAPGRAGRGRGLTLLRKKFYEHAKAEIPDLESKVAAGDFRELLTLLQDNFDWQDLRRDLLPGILGQFEMLGKTIYTHIISHE